MSALFLDAQFVKAEIARLIDIYPELADDIDLRADMINGETNANRIIERALEQRREAETMAAAIKEREQDLHSRRGRFERKADAMKTLIQSVMGAADLDKVELPEATIFVTSPRTSVGIEDLEALPQGYFKTVRQADKAAIKSALERGEEIPGAFLVLGDEGLTIRTK